MSWYRSHCYGYDGVQLRVGEDGAALGLDRAMALVILIFSWAWVIFFLLDGATWRISQHWLLLRLHSVASSISHAVCPEIYGQQQNWEHAAWPALAWIFSGLDWRQDYVVMFVLPWQFN